MCSDITKDFENSSGDEEFGLYIRKTYRRNLREWAEQNKASDLFLFR